MRKSGCMRANIARRRNDSKSAGRIGLAGVLALAAVFGPAAAASWRAGAADGRLGFRFVQAGVPEEGVFRAFDARFEFDPAHPEGGTACVEVATASVDSGDEERDTILRSADFFDVARHPLAVYRGRLRRAGEALRLEGVLRLRGRDAPVALDARLEPAAEGWRLVVRGTLDRLAFSVGEGDWADPQWIGREVAVEARLRLRPDDGAAGLARAGKGVENGCQAATEDGRDDGKAGPGPFR
ncbi:MAG: hypothetical protein KatS3mg121_0450 [Gammaproteobacteria bacterium]|nr:MAG: hypothetical protein KatS3mg121_0450 [Gammaproteobacteria bacterium]